MINKHTLPITLLALAIGFGLTAAHAQHTTPTTSTIISLGGKQIMDIRTGAGGLTPQQRAEAVRERLIPILSITHLTPEDVRVQQPRPHQAASIYVRGHLLVTVDRTLARADGTKPFTLANRWAATLADVLPSVNARPNPNGI